MKKQEQETINAMRLQGKSASEIAWALGISVNTVRSHIRRNPELEGGKPCKNCGRPITALSEERKSCSARTNAVWLGGTATGNRFRRKHIIVSLAPVVERSLKAIETKIVNSVARSVTSGHAAPIPHRVLVRYQINLGHAA